MLTFPNLSRKISIGNDSREDIEKWLRDVMLFVSPVIPRLESKEIIFNFILGGNPVILFLHEYRAQIMECVTYVAETTRNPKLQILIRLPLIIKVYDDMVVPEFEKINEASLQDLRKIDPDYYDLLFPDSDKETSHVG